MVEKVVILGTAPSLFKTPWDRKDCEYWACAPVITHRIKKDGPLIIDVHRIDAIFEMHPDEYWKTVIDRLNNFANKNQNCKIYMQNKNNEIINSVAYPLEDIQSMLNHPRLRNNFTSTIAYMIALAIYKGFKTIELYGVHMASQEEEYSLQKEGCASLLSYGWGRGVDFVLPEESSILKVSYLYGYEQEKGKILDAIHYRDGLKRAASELENRLKKLNDDYHEQIGAVKGFDNYIDELKKTGA